MASHSTDARIPDRAGALPPPEIPVKHTAWFMWMLWALAGLLVVALGYSFWRLSSVASPKLDVPQQPATVSGRAD